jgi:hypothetical protein
VLNAVSPELLPVRDDQRHVEGSIRSVDQGLGDEVGLGQGFLDQGGHHVLAWEGGRE